VVVRVPVTQVEGEELLGAALSNRGMSIESVVRRAFAYMEKMGWARLQPKYVHELLEFDEYVRLYNRIFEGLVDIVYDVTILESSPRWLDELAQFVEV
jgi:hypothetical protein